MNQAVASCLVLSDFTVLPLVGLLANDQEAPLLRATPAPFGEVMPALLNDNHECWRDEHDIAVVWTLPEGVISGFRRTLDFESAQGTEILDEVDRLCDAVEKAARRVRHCLVTNWVVPPYRRGFGILEMKPPVGITHTLAAMNLRLYDRLSEISNAYVLDAQRWTAEAGANAFNPKLWYTAKVPFGNQVFVNAMHDIKASILGLTGQARKLIIVDLDDTIWGGIVGDDGWENLRLGGHDHVGEAFVDFQRALRAMSRRGILLGIVSKNTEEVALEAFQKNPEMVLNIDDFAGYRINWDDKAANISDLVNELNLGLQSVVFLDDSRIERERVRSALPEVLVPELPEDKMLYTRALLQLNCFDSPGLSNEDMARAEQYLAEHKRKSIQRKISSHDDWIRLLGVQVAFERLSPSNLERSAQLLNKTNQMNLRTRRMTADEFIGWSERDNCHVWVCRVSDKFGDSGLTAIMSLETAGEIGTIVDFVLSCRVMGRGVERAMVGKLCDYARGFGVTRLCAEYIETEKNSPCFEFWQKSGFDYDELSKVFSWLFERDYGYPNGMKIIEKL